FFKTYDISNEIIDENFNKENKEDFEITDASEEENNDKLIDMKVSQARTIW
ncbi:3115_t:CDS:2, partial [Funneliformis geosporum]